MSKSYSSGSNHTAIKRRCGAPVAIIRSWIEDNPRRRYLRCKFSNPAFSRGCGYFSWYDEVKVEWQENTINQLRLEKKNTINQPALSTRRKMITNCNPNLESKLEKQFN
ncbi:hypothetical protein RND81_11G103900 [Saponaria officinalis]|uniref:Zinc finger GRF-type domain-containing protein n=1 Tax=Saponaria officinalis TaxID=3572 RepID=A0AAW1HLD8_SAPOF